MNKVLIKTVGIVGLGDLGGKLALQAQAAGFEVVGFDITSTPKPSEAVDPELTIDNLSWPITAANSLTDLISAVDIIHWCAPVKALEMLTHLPEQSLLVLHCSTMEQSIKGRKLLQERSKIKGSIGIVHCLMNAQKTVIVQDDEQREILADHFTQLGLNPIAMSHDQHDDIMAQSQGLFALLISAGLRDKLHAWDEQGLLVPSAHELKEAIENRQANWTTVTIETILSNPQLKVFLHEILTSQQMRTNTINEQRNVT